MNNLLARVLSLAAMGSFLGAISAEALDGEAIPIYGLSMAGDLASQEWAKSRGAYELNPLHRGDLASSGAIHLGGTALVVYGDSKLPKKWQRWAIRGAYVLWTGFKISKNLEAGKRSSRGF